MILDNEQQRAMLIEIIEASTVSGKAIRPLSRLLYEIETASIVEQPKQEPSPTEA